MTRQPITMTLLLITALAASAGCSSVNPGSWNLAESLDVRRAMWWKSEEPEPQMPNRLVTTWTDTVLHKPGQKSQRGFGGRLVFFGRGSDQPVRVDGQLVVYAYDEANPNRETAQPTRRYIFPREQFKQHCSENTLGPSYSVWLPWDEVGGQRKNISLIARFEPHQGQLIAGEQTRHLLPGTQPPEEGPGSLPSMRQIQLAQHTAPADTESRDNSSAQNSQTHPKEMTAKSIRLSNRWQGRLAQPAPTRKGLRERLSIPATQPVIQPATQPRALPTIQETFPSRASRPAIFRGPAR